MTNSDPPPATTAPATTAPVFTAPAVAAPAVAAPAVAAPAGPEAALTPGRSATAAPRAVWPGPAGPARPSVLAAVAGAAVVSAVWVPLDRPGLGWLVAGLTGTAALFTAATRPPATDTVGTGARPDTVGTGARPDTVGRTGAGARPDATGAPGRAPVTDRAARVVWALATLALLAVGAVRAAGWLFVLCLLAALVTGVLAVAGGRTPGGMVTAAGLSVAAPLRALPWATRSLAGVGSATTMGRTLVSVVVSVGLLVVFGLLFASADAVFADLLSGLLPEASAATVVGWVLRGLVAVTVLLGGAYLLAAPPAVDAAGATPTRPVRRGEWALPLTLLNLLFAAFVLVQLTVLFGGSGHVLRTAGLTYAEYARSGFWQLLAVSALTLLVIGGAARWAPRRDRADRVLIRLLLGTLTALSLVVVASAYHRMQVYTEAYGATRLRVFVTTVELWLGLLFVLVGVAVLRLRAGWLPRLVVGTAVLALLGLAVVDPDRLIAERNVDRYAQTGRLDVTYLAGLSADAVPALRRLPEPQRACALRDIAAALPDDGWRTANLARARARNLLGPYPGYTYLDCSPGRPLR